MIQQVRLPSVAAPCPQFHLNVLLEPAASVPELFYVGGSRTAFPRCLPPVALDSPRLPRQLGPAEYGRALSHARAVIAARHHDAAHVWPWARSQRASASAAPSAPSMGPRWRRQRPALEFDRQSDKPAPDEGSQAIDFFGRGRPAIFRDWEAESQV